MKDIPVLFLDRDGTLIVDKNYLSHPTGIEFMPDALAGLRRFRAMGYALVMITNQSGIGRGYFSDEQLQAVHRRLQELLAAEGLALDAIYYCPHAPEAQCRCRKPATGMLEQACAEHGIDRSRALMVGDSQADMLLARNFGITALQICRDGATPDPLAQWSGPSLLAAAKWVATQKNHAGEAP